jgi:lysozyme
MLTKFIDVSRWQGEIDFNAVSKAGYAGVIARAIDQAQEVDPFLLRNLERARGTGKLWTGAYHNLINASVELQVDRFVSAVPDWRGVIPMVDSEQGASFKQLAAFVEAIKVELGVRPLVYLPRWYWLQLADKAPLPSTWTWVHSRYADDPGPLIPPLTSLKGHVWQHSDKGVVPGINASVDLNRYYGPEEEFLQLAVQ